MDILEAKWQGKAAKDRTKGAGAWVCPKCGQRLATVVFDYRAATRMCGGGGFVEIALVLPSGVDHKKGTGERFGPGPFYLGAGAHFEKTNRHAARQKHGQSERWDFGALLDESFGNEYAEENLLKIKRQRAPVAPLHITSEQLPATFQCSRPGCDTISRIEVLAAPNVLARIEKREAALESMGVVKSMFSKRYTRRKVAKDVFFG